MRTSRSKLCSRGVFLLALLSSMVFRISASRAGELSPNHAPQTVDAEAKAAWATVQRTWTSITTDEKRSREFFAPRYYTEDFRSGAPPLPYRAYYRIVTGRRKNRAEVELVLREQRFLPLQKHEGYGHPMADYHGVHLEESESVYDSNLRFRVARFWHWGCSSAPNGEVCERLQYGVTANGAGYAEVVRSQDGKVDCAADGWGGYTLSLGSVPGESDQKELDADGMWRASVTIQRDLPDCRVVKVLLSVHPEAVRDLTITCTELAGEVYSYISTSYPPPDWGDLRDGQEDKTIYYGITTRDHTWSWLFRENAYGRSGNQSSWDWRRVDEATYKAQLGRFLRDWGVEELQDRNGKKVALPIGIGDIVDR